MTDPNANTEPAPRIAPVERSEATDRQADLLDALGPAAGLNIFRTLANHPKLFRSWIGFGGRLLQGSTLPEWDRELVILRTAAMRIGLRVGSTRRDRPVGRGRR